MGDHVSSQQFKALVYTSIRQRITPLAFFQQYNEALSVTGPQLDVLKFSELLIEVACSDQEAHSLIFQYVDVLISNGAFSVIGFVQLITKFSNVNSSGVTTSFIKKVLQYLKIIRCDFEDEKDRLELCFIYVTVVKWLVELACRSVQIKSKEHYIVIESCVEALKFLSDDVFARTIMYFVCKDDNEALNEMLESMTVVEDMFNEYDNYDGFFDNRTQDMFDRLENLVKDFATKPEFATNFLSTYRFGTNKPEPVILSMCSFYATFRQLDTAADLWRSFSNMGQILGYSVTEVIRQLLRGAFVAQLDAYRNETRTAVADVFVLERVPEVLLIIRKEQVVDVDKLMDCLAELALNRTVFNGLDFYRSENTLFNFLEALQVRKVIDAEQAEGIQMQRDGSPPQGDLFPNFCSLSMDTTQPSSKYVYFQCAVTYANRFKPLYFAEDDQKFRAVLSEFFAEVSLDLLDFFISVLCSRSDIYTFLTVLADIHKESETKCGVDPESLHLFDLTFLLISRTNCLAMEMEMEDLCGGIDHSVVFRFIQNYRESLNTDHPCQVSNNILQMAASYNIFEGSSLTHMTSDIDQLVQLVSGIGALILQEFSKLKDSEKSIVCEKLLESFGDISSLLSVLTQYLHVAKSYCKYDFAFFLRDAVKKHLKKLHSTKDAKVQRRWRLAEEQTSELLKLIADGPPPHEPIYPVLMNCAIGEIRPLRVNETPDMNMLKYAFFIASQKNYACQNVLSYVVDLNRKRMYENWIKCWLQQVCKHESVDEFEAAAELSIGAALSLPSECFLRLAELLIEDKHLLSGYNHIWALARLLVRILFVLCWTKKQNTEVVSRFAERRRMRRKRKTAQGGYRRIPSSPEPHTYSNEIDATVKRIIEKFEISLMQTTLDHKKTLASFFVKELTSCTPNPFQKQILQLIPQQMFVNTIHRAFTDIDIAAFLNAFGMEDENSRKLCLHIACLLRGLGKI
ncbi:unnamed protein product [Bursaphelenchus okinawaensis]|uniref:Mediator of RNA polymerase II transcription subunit 24 n=1 Tax=Bursaphelenchus okinawaensis TaxID=465554 RepID=A0A811JTG7_9BILA|nr:unnamed protein product [Bursaphelenchus okinawaensis]CAG9083002.1 unnamed protein product [Bursaphelenchus okinawaensis]